MDNERSVRAQLNNTLYELLKTSAVAKKALGRYLHSILPSWLANQCDMSREVASAAKRAFGLLSPEGQSKAILLTRKEIAEVARERIASVTSTNEHFSGSKEDAFQAAVLFYLFYYPFLFLLFFLFFFFFLFLFSFSFFFFFFELMKKVFIILIRLL